jgi:hypothetical protein
MGGLDKLVDESIRHARKTKTSTEQRGVALDVLDGVLNRCDFRMVEPEGSGEGVAQKEVRTDSGSRKHGTTDRQTDWYAFRIKIKKNICMCIE